MNILLHPLKIRKREVIAKPDDVLKLPVIFVGEILHWIKKRSNSWFLPLYPFQLFGRHCSCSSGSFRFHCTPVLLWETLYSIAITLSWRVKRQRGLEGWQLRLDSPHLMSGTSLRHAYLAGTILIIGLCIPILPTEWPWVSSATISSKNTSPSLPWATKAIFFYWIFL